MIKIILGMFLASSLLFSFEMDFDKNTQCLVRHIKVYENPAWVAKIELNNGKKVFFSTPKSMFEFYFRPSKWYEVGVKNENDFKDIVVIDYNTLKAINAREAFFVYGSRAISPAGDDLVPFKSKKEAEEFVKKEGGSRIFSFDKVPNGLIKLLNNSL